MNYVKRIDRGDEPSPKGDFPPWLGTLRHDPFEALDVVADQPLRWIDDPHDVDGYWVATRFDDVKEILQDAETFSSIDSQIPFVQMADPLLPTETDPPDTQKLRAILMPHLTAKKAMEKIPRMEQVCRTIIGEFIRDGHCEFVEQFARVYPITIFVEMFGLPLDQREEFRTQANIFLHSAEHRADAWNKIRAIVTEQLEIKRDDPKEDLLSSIATSQFNGQPIDIVTATSVASTLFLGGLDTLPSNLAWSFRFLAQNPGHRRQLVENPSLIPQAVEEFLRAFAVASPLRRVTRNVQFHGANLVAGDRIFCSISAANRDKGVFGDEVDFERKVNPHLTFATGPHRCLGSHIARQEMIIALRIWHELIPDYRVPVDADFSYQGPVLAMANLPLEWGV
jgi:cytochrome P450